MLYANIAFYQVFYKNYSVQKKTVDKTSEHHFNFQRIQDKI